MHSGERERDWVLGSKLLTFLNPIGKSCNMLDQSGINLSWYSFENPTQRDIPRLGGGAL